MLRHQDRCAKFSTSNGSGHDRYKDLTEVDKTFQTCKTGHLEIRYAFVQTEASTRGHVFLVMLVYLLERKFERLWKLIEMTVPEAISNWVRCGALLSGWVRIPAKRFPDPQTERKSYLMQMTSVCLRFCT
jgi:hypothetical protein